MKKIMISKLKHLLSNLSSINLSYPHIIMYKYYILACLGLIFLSSYIYIAFFRARIPREIPFNLTEIWFYIILFICCMYLYAIKQILKPKSPPAFLILLLQKCAYPFSLLDYYIKNYKYIKPYYEKLRDYIVSYLINDRGLIRPTLIIIYELLPRAILVLIFLSDVFIVGKLEIFYYFIFIGLIPFGFKYFQYSLYYACEEYIRYLESLYSHIWVLDNYSKSRPIEEWHPKAIYHDKLVSIRKFLKIQEENSMETYPDDFEVEYFGTPIAQEEILNNYHIKNNKINVKLTTRDYDIIKKPYYTLIDTLTEFYSFLEVFKFTPTSYNVIPYTKIFIFVSFFICWAYILIKSYHKVTSWPITLKVLQILVNSLPMMEPFSNTFL